MSQEENKKCLCSEYGNKSCDDLYNCCDCGGNGCGCSGCWSCNTCENCNPSEVEEI